MENSPQPISDIRILATEAFHAKRISVESAKAIFALLEGLEENVEHISHILEREIQDIVERQGEAMKEDAHFLSRFTKLQ